MNNENDYSFKTIPEMFLNICKKFGSTKEAIKYKKNQSEQYIGLTYDELLEKVESFAIGLLNLGIRPKDRVGIISENRLEWIISDLAIVSIGACDVPIFPILTAKQVEYIFSDCQVSAIVVSNDFQLNKVMQFKDSLQSLRHVIVMNDEFKVDDVAVKSMRYVMERGGTIRNPEERRQIFLEHCNKVEEDDLLTLIYTSGTTGTPKGVMLTHKNVCSNVKNSVQSVGFSEKDTVLSFLPLCHSYERTTGYYSALSVGATIYLAESVESVAANLLEARPTLMTVVPRLLETVKKRIFSNIEKEPPAKRKIFNTAVKIGREYVRRKMENKNVIHLAIPYALADKLVFSKIRERFGGRIEKIVSGGAPLSEEVQEFFLAAGLNVLQGYGLTEASPVVSVARLGDNEIGTIGKPLVNVEVKIAEDGEILVRGDNVMKGYWNDPMATEAVIDKDGWLYTGDIGQWTEKGNLKITDRKKHIFVNSGGKNIAPQLIENILSQSKYIEHVVIIGDRREYCTALISPDFNRLAELADEFGIKYNSPEELILNEKIINHIKKDIDYLQRDLSKYEKVRKFRMLAQPFTVENGELSLKMSVKRHTIEQKYAELIEAMYGESKD